MLCCGAKVQPYRSPHESNKPVFMICNSDLGRGVLCPTSQVTLSFRAAGCLLLCSRGTMNLPLTLPPEYDSPLPPRVQHLSIQERQFRQGGLASAGLRCVVPPYYQVSFFRKRRSLLPRPMIVVPPFLLHNVIPLQIAAFRVIQGLRICVSKICQMVLVFRE